MDGYIVHTEDGMFLGAFLDIHEAARFKYHCADSDKLEISKESKYRAKFLKPVQEKVTGRMLNLVDKRMKTLSKQAKNSIDLYRGGNPSTIQ